MVTVRSGLEGRQIRHELAAGALVTALAQLH